MKKHYPSAGPSISQSEIDLVTEAVTIGWYENRNLHTDLFIDEFKAIINRKYVLPVSNCTAAIHLSLIALGIKPGDEIIVPDITWIASVSPIIYVGAIPIFVDINADDWCISIDSLKNSITKKTKAIIIVDLFGNMPDMDELSKIASDNNLFLIEDAAESLGSKFKDKPAGSFGDVSVFSFNATKLAMAGQGGVLATNDEEIYSKAKLYSHHGMLKYTDKTTFWSIVVGYNYNWTNIQAALALAQIRRLDELVNHRRQIFQWYKDRLEHINGLQLNFESSNVLNTFWVVTVIVDKIYNKKKEDLLRLFSEINIDCRPFFYPASSMPAFKISSKKNYSKKNKISYTISEYGISLPSAASLTEIDIDYICNRFIELLNSKSKC